MRGGGRCALANYSIAPPRKTALLGAHPPLRAGVPVVLRCHGTSVAHPDCFACTYADFATRVDARPMPVPLDTKPALGLGLVGLGGRQACFDRSGVWWAGWCSFGAATLCNPESILSLIGSLSHLPPPRGWGAHACNVADWWAGGAGGGGGERGRGCGGKLIP